MATQNPTSGARRVPLFFDDYLEARELQPVARQKCTGCWGDGGLWSDLNNVYCEPCVRHQHGYDQAEENYVRGVIASAVDAAVSLGASEDLVRAALDDALSERVRVDATTYAAFDPAEHARFEARLQGRAR